MLDSELLQEARGQIRRAVLDSKVSLRRLLGQYKSASGTLGAAEVLDGLRNQIPGLQLEEREWQALAAHVVDPLGRFCESKFLAAIGTEPPKDFVIPEEPLKAVPQPERRVRRILESDIFDAAWDTICERHPEAKLRIWKEKASPIAEVRKAKLLPLQRLEGFGAVTSAAWDQSSTHLLIGTADGRLTCLEAGTFRVLRTLDFAFDAPAGIAGMRLSEEAAVPDAMKPRDMVSRLVAWSVGHKRDTSVKIDDGEASPEVEPGAQGAEKPCQSVSWLHIVEIISSCSDPSVELNVVAVKQLHGVTRDASISACGRFASASMADGQGMVFEIPRTPDSLAVLRDPSRNDPMAEASAGATSLDENDSNTSGQLESTEESEAKSEEEKRILIDLGDPILFWPAPLPFKRVEGTTPGEGTDAQEEGESAPAGAQDASEEDFKRLGPGISFLSERLLPDGEADYTRVASLDGRKSTSLRNALSSVEEREMVTAELQETFAPFYARHELSDVTTVAAVMWREGDSTWRRYSLRQQDRQEALVDAESFQDEAQPDKAAAKDKDKTKGEGKGKGKKQKDKASASKESLELSPEDAARKAMECRVAATTEKLLENAFLLPSAITACAVDATSLFVAFGLENGIVVIWQNDIGVLRDIVGKHPGRITALRFAGSQFLCSCCSKSNFVVFDIAPKAKVMGKALGRRCEHRSRRSSTLRPMGTGKVVLQQRVGSESLTGIEVRSSQSNPLAIVSAADNHVYVFSLRRTRPLRVLGLSEDGKVASRTDMIRLASGLRVSWMTPGTEAVPAQEDDEVPPAADAEDVDEKANTGEAEEAGEAGEAGEAAGVANHEGETPQHQELSDPEAPEEEGEDDDAEASRKASFAPILSVSDGSALLFLVRPSSPCVEDAAAPSEEKEEASQVSQIAFPPEQKPPLAEVYVDVYDWSMLDVLEDDIGTDMASRTQTASRVSLRTSSSAVPEAISKTSLTEANIRLFERDVHKDSATVNEDLFWMPSTGFLAYESPTAKVIAYMSAREDKRLRREARMRRRTRLLLQAL
eukprot:scaffold4562_cov255-Pinguiococcus_pyrenoidosus.AAC.10